MYLVIGVHDCYVRTDLVNQLVQNQTSVTNMNDTYLDGHMIKADIGTLLR